MQDRKTLGEYARIVGFNLGQTEKDYLQQVILQAIFGNTGNQMVFRGGTCVQKTINMPRFSEDLDFTAKEVNTEELCARIGKRIKYYGYENQYKKIKPITGETIKFIIKGPLYDGRPVTEAMVRLDVSRRENVVLETKVQTINPVYNDIPQYTANIMDEREILAEKVRAITTRKRARDLYDLNYLLSKNVRVEGRLVEEKFRYYSEEMDLSRIEESVGGMKDLWASEMKTLTRNPPEYTVVAGFVLEKLREGLS